MPARSIRTRMALAYGGVFATLSVLLAVASIAFLSFTSLQRVDEFLAESAATVATAIEFERNVGAADTAAIRTVVAEMQLPDGAVLAMDESTGHAIFSYEGLRYRRTVSTALEEALLDTLRNVARRAPEDPALTTLRAAGREIRVFTLPYKAGLRPLVIGVAQVMTARTRMLTDARWAIGIGLPMLLLWVSFVAWWLAGRGLAPVVAISQRAGEITASNLHERLPVANPDDELGRLARTFNALLDRLQAAFDGQARFSADASHELRTPVAVISGECELALSRSERPREDLVEALQVIRGESQRLRVIVDDLFFFARADGGELPVHRVPLHLDDLVEDSLRATRTLATARGVTVVSSVVEGALVSADEAMLRRAIDNLVVNAIKYSDANGRVEVTLRDGDGRWVVDIVDQGPGVSPGAQPHLFERFYRSEEARSLRTHEGAGLGLAIARWIARAHDGDVSLAATSDRGSTFRLTVPRASLPRDASGAASDRA